jgi:ABC-type transporter Mla MlaB component
MEIKELKTKVKVGFPEESEIFMAEEFLEDLSKVSLKEKPVELDFSEVRTLDTVFFQLAVSIIKTVNNSNNKVTLKTSEALENAEALYGINLGEMIGGGN